jgi:Mn-containing catalase
MAIVKELLVEQLQDLLDAETKLVDALPKMAQAANHPKLKEAFEKHLMQTQGQVERLNKAFQLLGEDAQSKQCRAIDGLIEEGEEKIEEGTEKDSIAADLSLVTSAQKIEHYEIASYGTARVLARQIGEIDVATLLDRTLGEEEAADHLLTEIAKPLLQEATFVEMSLASS